MTGVQTCAFRSIATGGGPTGRSEGIEFSQALLVGGIYVAIWATVASFLFVRRDVAN